MAVPSSGWGCAPEVYLQICPLELGRHPQEDVMHCGKVPRLAHCMDFRTDKNTLTISSAHAHG